MRLAPRIAETRWDHRVREARLLELWEKEGLYETEIEHGREFFVIDTPPPYASGKWHVGGAAHYAQIDMIARYFKLKGYNVVVPFYADRNGLPVEVQVEKTYKVVAKEMAKTVEGRREFLRLCKEFLDKAEEEIVRVWRVMGCSFDYWREGTDSPEYRRLTQQTFIELYKRGLIYEAERPVRWCPRCGTTLAEAEVEYEEEQGLLYYIRFPLERGGDVVVATTRPELLPACAALAYNPRDERYRGLAGIRAVAPIFGHFMDILEHDSVDPDFGTGIMMICSYGDEHDVRLFSELSLKPKVILDEHGRITEAGGPLAGLTVQEARVRVAELLKEHGYLVKIETVKHNVPKCWRCKTPLQIIHRREFFLEQLKFKEEVRRLADMMEFKPLMHKARLHDWIDSITMDWPISRDRYYGTEIPVWYCSKCGAKLLPSSEGYYKPWEENPWESCPHCGASKESIVGETRVFDTWFDSSISPLYVLERVKSKIKSEEDLAKAESNVMRPQGHDIVRTWLYYTILRVYQLKKRPAFRWVRITGMGLDPRGRPMHKSLGNVIDPEPVIQEYGADAFRFWAATAARLGYDYRFDEGKLRTGRLFVTKLWNIARFLSAFPHEESCERLVSTDRAFLALAEEYLEAVDRAYSELDVYEPGNLLYEFLWRVFADHYIELVKERAYNSDGRYGREEQVSAWATLHRIFSSMLIALSPIMPFITDDIFRELYGRSVHRERFPKLTLDEASRRKEASIARVVVKTNEKIWEYKTREGVKLSESLPGYRIVIVGDESLREIARDLEALHKIPAVLASTKPQLDECEEIAPPIYLCRG
ncbi:MAG: valine--tRNA ligase [Acidilobaceae archaeon]